MAEDKNKTAYIGIEREDNSVKYIAKVFNESPQQINKAQYNAIVKALRDENWATATEDEASIINKIISTNLEANLDEL
jgi:transcriptional regulator CtsR